ncbi:TPA: hypothetical protein DIV49_03950 [Candidatus Saccharibacteria bacterium]|nr:hypothetical protein [Candidatus Saccharibacteria bacterium]HRF28095.1 hypothetical protein [Candidatus Saccharibacteria bacterium]HRJ90666.1 hypothetical protein [Candidatus Saccharibacteria bacterium]
MAINAPERPTSNVTPAPEQSAQPGFFEKHRRAIGGTVAGLLLAGGAGGFLATRGGDKDPQDKRADQGAELVLDENGNPVRYVPFSEEHSDRDGNGIPDNRESKKDLLWDQETQQFVDPAEGSDEAALETASPEVLDQIAQIEAAFPDIAEREPHWKATFIGLDPLVQEFAITRLGQSGDFENETEWKSAILSVVRGDVSADEIRESAENAE